MRLPIADPGQVVLWKNTKVLSSAGEREAHWVKRVLWIKLFVIEPVFKNVKNFSAINVG